MTTTLVIDVGLIMAALAPTIAIVVAYVLAAKDARQKDTKLHGIHTLVNDAMTREKRTRLDIMQAQKIVLERVLGDSRSEDDLQLLERMGSRIAALRDEIDHRDQIASGVAGFRDKEA